MKSLRLLLLAGTAATLITSCEKDNSSEQNATADTTTAYSLDQAAAEAIIAELDQVAEDAERDNLEQYKTSLLPRCATLTRGTIQRPFRLIVDFGTSNCLCRDGKMRRGKLIITHQGRPRHAGSVRNIHTQNYYVNNREIVAQRTINHQGPNGQGQPMAQVSSQGYRLSMNRQDTLFWNGQRQRLFYRGYHTRQRHDDSFTHRGTLQVRHSNGRGFSSQTSQPVHHQAYCPYPVQGVVQIQPNDGRIRTLDFGNGQCDSLATLSVGNRSRTIVLKW